MNLHNSGPYSIMDPRCTTRAESRLLGGDRHAVDVDAGILQARFRRRINGRSSDAWAYHDWHQSGNGEVAPFMEHLEAEFGAATSLEDFERKAQMLNYVDHRAIFEGFNQHLWAPEQRPHAVDDAARVAQQHVADLQLGLRHAGVVLWCEKGVRAGACAARSLGLHVAVVNTTRCAAGVVASSDRLFAGQ